MSQMLRILLGFIQDDKADKIVALSPVCKHLGCTVSWNTDKEHPDQFFCPCHYGRYTKDGTNITGTPPLAPLDVYPLQGKRWLPLFRKS